MSHKYLVRAYVGVVREMCRYEGTKVVTQMAPQCDAKWVGTDLEIEYTTYLYCIEGYPNVRRWASFGVFVEPPAPADPMKPKQYILAGIS